MRGTIADIWAEEALALMPVSRPFDWFVEYTKRVTPTCLVHLERNHYSVPASFANRPVSLYQHTSVIITTNLSFSEWAGFSGDPKMTTRCSTASRITATSLKPEQQLPLQEQLSA